MNIGIDTKWLVYSFTGIGKYIRCIMDELQQCDISNNYYLFEAKESDYTLTNPNWKKIFDNWKYSSTLWQQLILPSQLKKYKIDILWAPEQTCPVLRRLPETKIITTIHDFVILRYPETCNAGDLFVKKRLAASSIKRSSGLIPVSDSVKEELFKFFPFVKSKIIRTVNNAVKDWGNISRHAHRENFLFFPGNLEPRKNLLRLIKALEIVNASGFELGLHICGPSGWRNSDILELMETSPIRNRLKHLGYLSENELREQYLKCKALIYPSIYEGFGIPVLEALNLGTPALTSKGTVMEEIAGPNAIYFDPYDVDSIAMAIIEFLKSGSTETDRKSLKRYTWKKSAESMLEVFGEVYRQGQ